MPATPSPESPLLIGILVDVSASMLGSMNNNAGVDENRLQAFQRALGQLAESGAHNSVNYTSDSVQVFAYGFGFGNVLSRFLDPRVVLDLLAEGSNAPTLCLGKLAENWERYQSHVESLVPKMFGATPMLAGFEEAHRRFDRERARLSPGTSVLFVLSDGEPTDVSGNLDPILRKAGTLKDGGTIIISCYVTDEDITDLRHLYKSPSESWPAGAKLMCDVASEIPEGVGFDQYLHEHNWSFEKGARLFCQVNQSEVLSEFMQLVVSPFGGSSVPEKPGTADAMKPSVFVSYSHTDVKWVDRLKVHLKPVVRNGEISLWSDDSIKPSELWRDEISGALAGASAAVLVVSADFLASDFINDVELPKLLEKARKDGLRIYPVVVSPCRFKESPVSKFQASHNPTQTLEGLTFVESEEALLELSRAIELQLCGG